MTQTTDQDRAEFEAAYVAEKLRIIGSDGSADGEKAIRAFMLRRNADGDYDNSLEAHFAWWAWQASRRAQVMPQGLDAQQLHSDIMNIQAGKHMGLSYREGHRDARHAAAELVLAAQAKQGA